MGRLQSGQTPGSPIMKPPDKPSVKQAAPQLDPEPYGHEWCDKCGYSTIDGQPIAAAKARVYVRNGVIHLCGHHLRINVPLLLERGYYFRSLV